MLVNVLVYLQTNMFYMKKKKKTQHSSTFFEEVAALDWLISFLCAGFN